jgi:hypothetical protein
MTEGDRGMSRLPSVDELLGEPPRALALPVDDARRLLLALAPVVEALRLAAGAPPPARATPAPDSWLTADEVAALLKTTRGAVYSMARRREWAPFCARANRRTLRISQRGLEHWLSLHAGT